MTPSADRARIIEMLRGDIDFGHVVFRNYLNLNDDDAEAVRRWRNSPGIRQWMFNSHIISPEEHLRFLSTLAINERAFYWMVTVNGAMSGAVNLQSVDLEAATADIGIFSFISGAGTIMLGLLMELWFERLGMSELRSQVLAGNERAIRFYEKVGFVRIGPGDAGRVAAGTEASIEMHLSRQVYAGLRMRASGMPGPRSAID